MQVGSGFAVYGYYGSKVRGYFYLGLDSVGNAWEEYSGPLGEQV